MKTIKNVVLVHGAFVNGSGWRGLYEILKKDGYTVTIVHNPLTTLEDGVLSVKAALDKQDGPSVLVGHSYGGVLITEAGNHPNAAVLVYVAAFQPDNGESALDWIQKAAPAAENGVLPPDDKGIVYYDKDKFHAGLCADLSREEAEFMYASQGAFYVKGFVTPVTNAAWRTKPSYAVIATDDKSIAPEIQETMYNRSNTVAAKVKASHAVYVSQPQAVADVIALASNAV